MYIYIYRAKYRISCHVRSTHCATYCKLNTLYKIDRMVSFTPETINELRDTLLDPDSCANIKTWNLTKLLSLSGLFKDLNMFTGTDKQDFISTWDVGHVTDMSCMFDGASKFCGDLSAWDVSRVTDMSYMFCNASLFNQDLSSWNVSNVTNMEYMFYSAHVFNQDIGGWTVSKVLNMNSMFRGTRAFNQYIGDWNVRSVESMEDMFRSSHTFNQYIGGWNVSSVTNMSRMFNDTSAFNQHIGNWNVSNVSDMSGMFASAKAFNKHIGNWNVSNVVNMRTMFFENGVFRQHIGNWTVPSDSTNSYNMFYQSILDGELKPGHERIHAPDSKEDLLKLLKNTDSLAYIHEWDVSKVTDLSDVFSGHDVVDSGIGNWNVSNVTTMDRMFKGVHTFDPGIIKHWNVVKVTSLDGMLDNATAKVQNNRLVVLPTLENVATSGADPYIHTVSGAVLKLPNAHGMYRMYQHRRTGIYVDIVVDHRKVDVPQISLLSRKGTPVDSGFYITALRFRDDRGMVQEMDTTSIDCLRQTDLPWEPALACRGVSDGSASDVGGLVYGAFWSRVLHIGQVARIEVRIYDNPQIMNSFTWYVPEQSDGFVDGLVYRNYTPKLYASGGKSHDVPFIRRNKTVLSRKGIVNRKEVAESVTHARLFNYMFRNDI